MALFMLIVLYTHDAALFGRTEDFALMALFLVFFPLLAYPIQPSIKKYKIRGREGQRTLAIYFTVAGISVDSSPL
jgi:hypothetical protein